MAEIDRLEIQIEAQASKANAQLESLIKKLDKVSASLSNVNSRGLATMGAGINKLANAMSNMNANTKTADFSRLARNLAKINEVDTSKFQSVASAINTMSTSLNRIGPVSENAQKIGELAKNLSKLGNKSVVNAIDNIPRLATALNNMMVTLSRSPSVSRNIIQMTQALAALAAQGNRTGASSRSLTSALNSYSLSAIRANKNTMSLASAFGKIYAKWWLLIRVAKQLKKAIDISSDLTEVQNVVDVTFGEFAQKVEDLASVSIPEFGMSELTVKDIASRFQAMGTAMGFSTGKMSDMSIELTKLAADMASFYNVEQKDVAEDLEAIFTGQTRPLRTYGLDLTQATLKEWAMKNGMDANVQAMSQMEKTMLRYQYVIANTGAAQGDFALTSDTWANQTRILAQSFQALGSIIGGTLINALKPFVKWMNTVIQQIISFAKVVSNALGKIFGWKYEESGGGITSDMEDAAAGAGDVADGMGDAADNAKKLRQQLSSIDELKVLSSDTAQSSGGSGSGGGASGGGGTAPEGQWNKSDSILKEYESSINTLYGLGKKIGEALTSAMNGIDWDSVYQKARNFGKGLADFLNGLISPELFGATGRTIAGSLNTAIYAALSFGETFDFKDFGLSIATGINEFFNIFDFSSFAKTINVWVNGVFDLFISTLSNTDWDKIGEKIGEFLSGLDLLKAIQKLSQIVEKAIKAAVKVWIGAFKEAPVETLIVTVGIAKKALKGLFAAEVLKKAKSFSTAILLLSKSLSGNMTATLLLTNTYPKLSQVVTKTLSAFTAFKTALTSGNFFGSMSASIDNLRNNMTGLQKGAVGAIGVFSEFVLIKSSFYDIAKGADNLALSIGKITVALGVAAGALKMIGLSNPWTAAITGVVAFIGAIAGISKALDEIETESIGNSIKNALTVPGGVSIEELASGFSEKMSQVADGFTNISTKSNELSTANQNINDVKVSLEATKIAMDNGAISTEEGCARIVTAFGTLESEGKTKIQLLEQTLIGSLGEGGVLHQSLIAMGYDVEGIKKGIVNFSEEIQKKIEALRIELEELSKTDPTNPRIAEITEELSGLVAEVDGTSATIMNYKRDMESTQIDLSEFISEDGLSYDETALADFLNSLDESVTSTQGTVKEKINELMNNTEALKGLADKLGMEEDSELFKTLIQGYADTLENTNGDIAAAAKSVTDTLETQLVGRISEVIESSSVEWENMSPFLRGDKDAFIKKAVDDYQNNIISPMSEQIKTEMEEFGVEGAGWSGAAAEKIIGEIFNPETYIRGMGSRKLSELTLKENYEEMINNALSEASEAIDAESYGKDTVDGYNNGIENNAESSKSKMQNWMSENFNSIHDSKMRFGSPSVAAWEFGRDTIFGYNNGIDDNKKSTEQYITLWMDSVKSSFEKNNWSTASSGMLTGIQTKWSEITTWWTGTAMPTFWNAHVMPWFTLEKWSTVLINVQKAFQTSWNLNVKQWDANISAWWTKSVIPWFELKKWDSVLENIKKSFDSTWKQTSTQWNSNMSDWWSKNVIPWFQYDKWYSSMSGIVTAFKDIFKNAANAAIGVMNQLVEKINSSMEFDMKWSDPITQKVFSSHAVLVKLPQIPAFQTGGFPEDGLFYANHNELVGQFSNGRTAVANNDQIVQGIQAGVYQAVYSAMNDASRGNSGSSQTGDIVVQISGKEVFRATRAEAREYYGRTGRSPFPV